MNKKTAIIGGGPAGIIAAGYSAQSGNTAVLFEKNEKLGKKLFITGKGRCNITNSSSIDELIENVAVNKNFMYSGFYSFTNEDIISLIESFGVETKVERGNRVFPKSDKSSDVIKALSKFLNSNDVKVELNSVVEDIDKRGDKFYLKVNGTEREFDSVILATGGKSYSSTGSTGDGYKFAKKLGHSIVDLKAALVPCEVKESWIKELQGLSLKNVNIKAFANGKKIYEDFGEMIFTHYGISGPIVLSMSNFINVHKGKNIEISIDLKPGLEHKQLENRIIRDFEKFSKKQFKNSLNDLLPGKLIPVVVKLSEIDEDKFVNQISKEERKKLVDILKDFKLGFKKLRPLEEAIITSGGISTEEIDPSTMESKIVKGLYFAGEMIDVDALTGGYNLQIAYSTGYLAGINS
jgi:predicted Rossmann fold flavoprotein